MTSNQVSGAKRVQYFQEQNKLLKFTCNTVVVKESATWQALYLTWSVINCDNYRPAPLASVLRDPIASQFD